MAMIKDVFPQSYGNETMPQMFKRFHRFLQETHLEQHLIESNQDLAVSLLPFLRNALKPQSNGWLIAA